MRSKEEVAEEMILSFEEGYEGRDDRLAALKESTDQNIEEHNIIQVAIPTGQPNDFYSLSRLR